MNYPTLEQTLDTFSYHQPNAAQIDRITAIRNAHKDLVAVIWGMVPAGPDRTVALRSVHESMMTCNKAIVTEPPFVRAADCPSHDSRCTAEHCIGDRHSPIYVPPPEWRFR